MSYWETFELLLKWSPYLAGGFALNILISVTSMAVGTCWGLVLGWARGRRRFLVPECGAGLTMICRNVPSFVLMFYLAFMVPVEVSWGGELYLVPAWVKASLALTIPVIGFCSDQFAGGAAAGRRRLGRTFWVSWVQYFLIIVMASATASVIGADEIVGRINTVVAIVNESGFLITAYGFVAAWFILFGLLFKFLTGLVGKMVLSAGKPTGLQAQE